MAQTGSETGRTGKARSTGPIGTVARLMVGSGLIVGAGVIGPTLAEFILGILVIPGGTTLVLAARGRTARPLRLTGPEGHLINGAIGVAAFVLLPVSAMLFYGSSMLLAAGRGYAGCELFAVSNWLRSRDDEIACPVFWRIDLREARARERRI